MHKHLQPALRWKRQRNFYVISVKPTEVYQSQPAITLNILVALGNCLFCLGRRDNPGIESDKPYFLVNKSPCVRFLSSHPSRNNHAEAKAQASNKPSQSWPHEPNSSAQRGCWAPSGCLYHLLAAPAAAPQPTTILRPARPLPNQSPRLNHQPRLASHKPTRYAAGCFHSLAVMFEGSCFHSGQIFSLNHSSRP